MSRHGSAIAFRSTFSNGHIWRLPAWPLSANSRRMRSQQKGILTEILVIERSSR